MNRPEPIRIWDRAGGREILEKVPAAAVLGWLYRAGAGKVLARTILVRRWFNRLEGWYWSSSLSRGRIAPFIRDHGIPMEEFVREEYRSFNEFFVRRFRPGRRTFCEEPHRMPAFAEARYLAFGRLSADTRFPVKGMEMDAVLALGGPAEAGRFEGGPLLVARLCPVDYHRYHYPDEGSTTRSYTIPGRLDSVNPIALESKAGILTGNHRRVSLLETERLGRLAYVEVGAMGVGRIVQTHPEDRSFRRGDEKGAFLFGASTVLLLGEPGRWIPDDDLLRNTGEGRETLVRLGEGIATVE